MHKTPTIPLLIIILAINHNLMQVKAQNRDPEQLYQTLYQAREDTVRIKAMYDLYRFYYYTKIDSALFYAKSAFNLSRINQNFQLGKVSMGLGHAYSQAGDYDNSTKYLTIAYDEAKKQNYESIYAVLLADIGLNYHFINDNENALQYLYKALELSIDYNGKIVAYYNLAQIMSANENYPKANEYYYAALKLAKENKNTDDEAVIYNRQAVIKLSEKKYQQALELYQKSLSMIDSSKIYYRITNYSGLAESYLFLANYNKALTFANLSNSIAKEAGFIYEEHMAKRLLSEIYDTLNRYDISLAFYKEYSRLKDSILNKESKEKLDLLHVEFQTREKEIQIVLLQKQAAFKNKMLLVYVIVSVLIAVVLIYLVKNTRLKNKMLIFEKEKETFQKQKIELELHQKKRELLTHVIQISQQKELLSSIQTKIKKTAELKANEKIVGELQALKREIKTKISHSNNWEQIKMHFEKVHPTFFDLLRKNYPELSINELKLCAYTKLNLSGKEIGNLLNINHTSVQMARYRLKKKMKIEEEQNFNDFILTNY